MMGFYRSLTDSTDSQVSRSVLSILADLNNAVDWMFSSCPLISKFFRPYINPSVAVPRVPITIGIMVTFIFLSFCNSLEKSRYFLFVFFQFVVCRDSKFHNTASSLFLIIVRSCRLTEI